MDGILAERTTKALQELATQQRVANLLAWLDGWASHPRAREAEAEVQRLLFPE